MTSLKDSLIDRAAELFILAEQIQKEPPPNEPERKKKIEELGAYYRTWYHKALSLLSSRPDLQKDFMREHDGGFINPGIKGFLLRGWQIYVLYDPDKPSNPLIPKWSVTFDSSFKAPLQKQCDILAALGVPVERLIDLEQDKHHTPDNDNMYEGGLSDETLRQLRQALIKCGPFNSDDQLRSVFVDSRINLWKSFLQQTNNQQQRVNSLIEFLIDRNHKLLGNGLILFLAVVKDTIDENDSCWESLESLILQLQREIQHSPLNSPRSSTLEENQIEYDFLEAQLKLEHEYESEKRKAVQILDALRLQQAKWEFDRQMDIAKKLRDFKLTQLTNN